MRFDPQKAFPYPVLRSDINDFTAGDFQVTVDFKHSDDRKSITVEGSQFLSVPEIKAQIDAGKANYVALISCRETYFRETILTQKTTFKRTYASGAFRGEVTVLPFVAAVAPIDDFSSPDINSEFAKSSFDYSIGEILALDQPKVIYVDRDLFKPVSSVFEIVHAEGMSGYEWRLDFDQPKVQIQLSHVAKDTVDAARNSTNDRAVLINSLYFSAVTEAVQRLKETEEYDHLRWARVIRQKCHNMAIDLNSHDSSVIAQKLLQSPMKLLKDYVFEEAGS
jgi:hypothetical protein